MRVYTTGFNSYTTFCSQSAVSPLPAHEHNLLLFCSYLSLRVGAKTIKTYLSGIRFHSILAGHPLDLSRMLQLYYLIRGIKLTQGSRHLKSLCNPITVPRLQVIHSWLQTSHLSANDRHLWWSACTLAFFGLLRVSEYSATSSHAADADVCLGCSDIHFDSQFSYMQVTVKSSKTDPFKHGCTIHVGSTGNLLCPIMAMRQFMLSRVSFHQFPLYVFSDGSFLTRSRMSRFLTTVFGDVNLNTHSFRIGGATALAAAGFSDSSIQTIGRWSSDCFTRYIRLSSATLQAYAGSMCHDSGATCWDPLLFRLR